MASFLVVYGTSEGQTAKVANTIEEVLSEERHTVTTLHVSEALTVNDFDGVILGAFVHNGRCQPEVTAFVSEHSDTLNSMPAAFF